ncbi:hypothetical protein L6164_013706 [Bauhinia variegata]|uniref:Uncharacterized protein n=1 Tax=Bauhinia variegata TaxID=167791 RepID=A0ACB9NGP9_BAUVA|nr:hypothetical protein L6164_013706 [Bauhinia variegata]
MEALLHASPVAYAAATKCSKNFRRNTRKPVSVIVVARKNYKKEETRSFEPKPDEATAFFPQAVLLKEMKVEQDGQLLPEFADAEEMSVQHYEVVYLIHEKHAEEVAAVNEKVQTFLREKKGRVWKPNISTSSRTLRSNMYDDDEEEEEYDTEYDDDWDEENEMMDGYDDDNGDEDDGREYRHDTSGNVKTARNAKIEGSESRYR